MCEPPLASAHPRHLFQEQSPPFALDTVSIYSEQRSTMTIPVQTIEWYRDQVIFLTGATGNLGGCLLYKLAVNLPVAKIYVLCRGSVHQAMQKWETSMAEQIDEIFDTGKIHCLIGDITQPNFGLGKSELEILRHEVTVAIHSAACLSFFQDLAGSIRDNCLPVMEIARILLSFHKLEAFLHVSSIASQSFLLGESVLEEAGLVSPDEGLPDTQLSAILATGESQYAERFFAPYAQAKYLAEQYLLNLDTPFPILIVRPTNIGPAIQDPYPLYGPEGAIPLYTFLQLIVESGEHRRLDRFDLPSRDIVIDEIPVDLVANTCLLHLATGSRGIVHAGSQLYVPVTLSQIITQIREYVPQALLEKADRSRVKKNLYTANQANIILERICRKWQIDCQRSLQFKSTQGPIGLALSGHDFDAFTEKRFLQRARAVESWIESLGL